MPSRRKRECKKVGCHALTDSADGYCEQHKKEKWAASDERRKSARERGYDAHVGKIPQGIFNKPSALRGLPEQKNSARGYGS